MEEPKKLKYKYEHTEIKPIEEKPKTKSSYEKLREAHTYIDNME